MILSSSRVLSWSPIIIIIIISPIEEEKRILVIGSAPVPADFCPHSVHFCWKAEGVTDGATTTTPQISCYERTSGLNVGGQWNFIRGEKTGLDGKWANHSPFSGMYKSVSCGGNGPKECNIEFEKTIPFPAALEEEYWVIILPRQVIYDYIVGRAKHLWVSIRQDQVWETSVRRVTLFDDETQKSSQSFFSGSLSRRERRDHNIEQFLTMPFFVALDIFTSPKTYPDFFLDWGRFLGHVSCTSLTRCSQFWKEWKGQKRILIIGTYRTRPKNMSCVQSYKFGVSWHFTISFFAPHQNAPFHWPQRNFETRPLLEKVLIWQGCYTFI